MGMDRCRWQRRINAKGLKRQGETRWMVFFYSSVRERTAVSFEDIAVCDKKGCLVRVSLLLVQSTGVCFFVGHVRCVCPPLLQGDKRIRCRCVCVCVFSLPSHVLGSLDFLSSSC